MKKAIWMPLAAIMVAVMLTACFKKDDTVQCTSNTLTRDKQIIDSILGSEISSYTFDEQASLYYRIDEPGSGEQPTTTDSLVAFKYVGRILNGFGDGAIIDSLTVKEATYKVSDFSGLIGVTYALPKIRKGGSISVIIPSSQLFGCNEVNGVNRIPANSQLIYQYDLTDVKRGN